MRWERRARGISTFPTRKAASPVRTAPHHVGKSPLLVRNVDLPAWKPRFPRSISRQPGRKCGSRIPKRAIGARGRVLHRRPRRPLPYGSGHPASKPGHGIRKRGGRSGSVGRISARSGAARASGREHDHDRRARAEPRRAGLRGPFAPPLPYRGDCERDRARIVLCNAVGTLRFDRSGFIALTAGGRRRVQESLIDDEAVRPLA